jgi:hypothetical protein
MPCFHQYDALARAGQEDILWKLEGVSRMAALFESVFALIYSLDYREPLAPFV